MRRALPLSFQLVLTFVGLVVGTAAVLTTDAYSSLVASLEADASRNVGLATRTREQTLTQLFHHRQQRASGLLASIESLCAERLDSGRLAWVDDCTRTMVNDFRNSERALGAVLTYRNRRVARSGARVSGATPPAGALATVIFRPDGVAQYLTAATQGQTTLTLLFDQQEVAAVFDDQSGVSRSGEVYLADYNGQFLTRVRHGASAIPRERAAEFQQHCQSGEEPFIGLDYRGVKTFQSFRPLSALGSACIAASVGYDEALAPAERLRSDLLIHGGWFVLVGVVLSLVAAQWISAPVRRLSVWARQLQTGRFDRPIPLAGPSEVQALGRAFNAMANDVAELVAKEQAARRVAEEANRTKDEFLATVSHELRTPLSAILGWAQMLRTERLPPEQVRHGMVVIERSARAQSQLIDDLLDVSRIASKNLRITRAPVRLVEVIEAALDAVRPQATEKQVKIVTDISEQALVLGDARRLEQVVWNLAWNAVKFTQRSGRITVQLKRVERLLVLTVADTGVGISSAFLPYVFDWFRQEDARSRSQSGLGLGLGIVRHLVQLHGGSVKAESRGLGHGATFTVTLPVHEPVTAVQSLQRQAVQPPRTITSRLDAARILIVEDDEDTRELVRSILESVGASVEAVGTANDARREVLAEAPDVLISDIRMPEEDGYSLMRSLREAGITVPAIALTAHARSADADEAHAAGFQIHLAKPVDIGRLIDAVAALLRSESVH
jgi:signal transduction histidine kinase/ActR/RegA family two-component response regulator